MSELAMNKEILEGITISAPTDADAEAIGPMHLQSWIETYQNPELGVDEAWIKENIGFVASPDGTKHRQDIFDRLKAGDPTVWYRVAKDQDGQVVGFAMASKKDDSKQNELDALYTLQRVQGKGLGRKLMEEALDWLGDDKPVRLQAIEYNQHALDFYKKFGFQLTGERDHYKGPLYAAEMVREKIQ